MYQDNYAIVAVAINESVTEGALKWGVFWPDTTQSSYNGDFIALYKPERLPLQTSPQVNKTSLATKEQQLWNSETTIANSSLICIHEQNLAHDIIINLAHT